MAQRSAPAVKSASRALDILEYVAHRSEAPTFPEIGADLEIPSSSLSYMLATLVGRGYLQQSSPKSGYRLGPALTILSKYAPQDAGWSDVVRPLVQDVWSRLHETTSFFEPRDDEMECMLVRLAEHSLIPIHKVGERTPLYVHSGGKVVLVERGATYFDSYINRVELKAFTPHTITSAAKLRREISEVRSTGIGISREERSLGTLGMSVGLRAASGVIGTLGVAIPAVRFNKSIETQIRTVLKAAAQEFHSMGASKRS